MVGAHLQEALAAGAVLVHPAAREAAVLDLRQDLLHLALDAVVDQALAGHVVAEFGGVRHRVAHQRHAALVDQVDDQLHLVDGLEVGHLRGVARLDQRLVAGLHQVGQAAAQHRLFAEQVGLGLLAEVGLDDPGACAADCRGVRQGQVLAAAGCVVGHRHQARHAVAEFILAAHGVTGPLGGDHGHVHVGVRLDQPEMDVEAVGEHQVVAGRQTRLDVALVDLRLQVIRHQHHDRVGPGRGGGRLQHRYAGFLDLGRAGAVGTQPDSHFHARVAQVVGVRKALTAVSDHRHFLAGDPLALDVVLVIDLHDSSRFR